MPDPHDDALARLLQPAPVLVLLADLLHVGAELLVDVLVLVLILGSLPLQAQVLREGVLVLVAGGLLVEAGLRLDPEDGVREGDHGLPLGGAPQGEVLRMRGVGAEGGGGPQEQLGLVVRGHRELAALVGADQGARREPAAGLEVLQRLGVLGGAEIDRGEERVHTRRQQVAGGRGPRARGGGGGGGVAPRVLRVLGLLCAVLRPALAREQKLEVVLERGRHEVGILGGHRLQRRRRGVRGVRGPEAAGGGGVLVVAGPGGHHALRLLLPQKLLESPLLIILCQNELRFHSNPNL